MIYGSTTKATNWQPKRRREKFVRALLWFIPAASPDHEKFYPLVKRWALEIDELGRANREIGLGENGEVLFRAPDERNMGMWTDSSMIFGAGDLEPMEQSKFEALWAESKQ